MGRIGTSEVGLNGLGCLVDFLQNLSESLPNSCQT